MAIGSPGSCWPGGGGPPGAPGGGGAAPGGGMKDVDMVAATNPAAATAEIDLVENSRSIRIFFGKSATKQATNDATAASLKDVY